MESAWLHLRASAVKGRQFLAKISLSPGSYLHSHHSRRFPSQFWLLLPNMSSGSQGDEYLEVWAEAGWSREDRPGQLDEDPLTHFDAKPF